MQDIFTEVKLPEDFLNELARRFHEDGLIDVLGSTIAGIGEEIALMKFNENYRSVAIRVHSIYAIETKIQAITLLVQIKPIAAIMPDLPNWIPTQASSSGALIEQSSFLGHFFALSPFAPGVPQKFFKDPKLMAPGDRLSMTNSIQEAVRQYQNGLHKICHLIVTSGDHGRRGVLDWFSAALSQNQKRKALQVDPTTVASDGFMCNVVAVLNKFAEPFVDLHGKKVSRQTKRIWINIIRSTK